MKKVHMLLDRESWQELQDLKEKLKVNQLGDAFGKKDDEPKTYEEYLEREKKNPTMALFG